MGSYRMRFNQEERRSFVAGAEVEWLNATTWKSGVVQGPVEFDSGVGSDPRQHVLPVTNTSPTGFTRRGEVVRVYPKHVRLPHVPAAMPGGDAELLRRNSVSDRQD